MANVRVVRPSNPNRWLNKPPARKLNAARAIAVPRDQPETPVPMVAMASTDSQASREIVAHRPPAASSRPISHLRIAHAILHRETPAHKDRADRTDQLVMLAHPALTDNLAAQALPAHKDLPDHPVKMEPPAHKVTLARPPDQLPAQPVNPARTENPALPALLVNPAAQAKTVAPAALVLPEMLVLQETQEKLVPKARTATLAKTDHPAAAPTVHRLVWLQVGKQSRPSNFIGDIESENEIPSNEFSPISTFSFAILAFSCVFSGKA